MGCFTGYRPQWVIKSVLCLPWLYGPVCFEWNVDNIEAVEYNGLYFFLARASQLLTMSILFNYLANISGFAQVIQSS